MNTPPHERWVRIEQLLDAALELPPSDRAAFLQRECAEEPDLLEEVSALLEAGEGPPFELDAPAAVFAAQLVAQTADAELPDNVHIGPWRIVRALGRGGMGAVYLAERDAHFRQRAALKLVRRGLHLDPDLVRRFVEERQILASLEHGGIARLLDGGVTADGVPWLAMEYVEGQPIEQWCDANRLSIDARLELFCAVCEAVGYAHRQNVVHRDIKPSNIHVKADGTVKLLDFGIARLIAPDTDAASALTRTGLRLFTPEYASPEQLRGEAVTTTSDVYSLGVLLYELLTGRRPFRSTGRSAGELAEAAVTREPTRPSVAVVRALEQVDGERESLTPTQLARARESTPERLSQRLRGELDRIVLHALARDPARRYASADQLAADVRRHLEGLPVTARAPASPRRKRILAGTAGLAAAFALAFALWGTRSNDAVPVLAVGLIADYRTDRSSELGRPLADLLAMNLARLPRLRVISPARMYELLGQLAGSPADPGTHSTAARRAGATSLIDGAVFALEDGRIRLDIRQVDLATGDVQAAHSVSGRDLFALVDSGTARLATAAGLQAPGAVSDVTTRSEIAYRLYGEGVRAYYLNDTNGARRLLEAALAEDSTFAMAAFYLGRLAASDELAREPIERALRLAERTSDRERLIIRAFWAQWTSDPTLLATAETLAVRYPDELSGNLYAGMALYQAADYPRALDRFRRVILADSLGREGKSASCTPCDARSWITDTYVAMDSLDAAIREARAWIALQPGTAAPLRRLGILLMQASRVTEAREAYRHAAQLNPAFNGLASYYAFFHLAAGDYATTDDALREMIRSGALDRQAQAEFYLALSLRWQGRYGDALESARRFRVLMNRIRPAQAAKRYALTEAQLLYDAGRYREAAALFDSIAHEPGVSVSREASWAAWALTHAANALARLGDTTALRARIDTIQQLGSRSLLARDQRLHHHVRGLLLEAQGNVDDAIVEFRGALHSPVIGYTRAHYELARALQRRGRHREAVAVLQPIIPWSLEGAGFHVTRPELEEALALAWDALGARDSALVHLRNVAHAWRNADPILRDRVRAMQARIAALEAR